MDWTTRWPRLHDLYLGSDRKHADNYFAMVTRQALPPLACEVYDSIERSLEGLDQCAWEQLRAKALPLVTSRDKEKSRDWQQLFDILNEAHGYHFLAKMGCHSIQFLCGKGPTPDLIAELDKRRVLLEVKSFNQSDENIIALNERPPVVSRVDWEPSAALRRKLACIVKGARDQLLAYQPEVPADLHVLILLCLDTNVRVSADQMRQLEEESTAAESVQVHIQEAG